jgi:hypothetical protein
MGAGAKLNPEDAGAGEVLVFVFVPLLVPKENVGLLSPV